MKLLAVEAELHVFEGRANWRQPVRLGLSFDGRDFVRICGRRGDHVILDADPLEAAEFGEGGRIEVCDITDAVDASLRGLEVNRVRLVEGGFGHPIGVALLAADRTFCFWIDDDDFDWGSWEALCEANLAAAVCPKLGAVI